MFVVMPHSSIKYSDVLETKILLAITVVRKHHNQNGFTREYVI